MPAKDKKTTQDLANGYIRDEILGALKALGGKDYLVQMATTDPKSFISLVAKILPSELKADVTVNPLSELMKEIDGNTKTLP